QDVQRGLIGSAAGIAALTVFISRSAGYAPASRGIERELRKRNSDSPASGGMEFRKRNSERNAIRASANWR
ncbi:hypothetical protein AB0L08_30330, partial [Streptomyces albidoflavus]